MRGWIGGLGAVVASWTFCNCASDEGSGGGPATSGATGGGGSTATTGQGGTTSTGQGGSSGGAAGSSSSAGGATTGGSAGQGGATATGGAAGATTATGGSAGQAGTGNPGGASGASIDAGRDGDGSAVDAAADATDGPRCEASPGGMVGDAGSCGVAPAAVPSCAGLAANCGPNGNESCCETRCVPGGAFRLGRATCDPDELACTSSGGPLTCRTSELPSAQATIRPYWLDRFEVTVGRYRKFVAAVVAGWRPAAGSGQHGYLAGGETGWNASWTIPTTASAFDFALQCDLGTQTWTPSPGANETRPMTCVDWYASYAFCIWDGGFLPTEAEWELASSGGEERVFPWSSPPSSVLLEDRHACYIGCTYERVGSKPAGDGRWGHADLSGSVWEWALDTFISAYTIDPCNDCFLTDAGRNLRVKRGGYGGYVSTTLRSAFREYGDRELAVALNGVRCARAAP